MTNLLFGDHNALGTVRVNGDILYIYIYIGQ